MVKNKTGVSLPEDEAGFIALHIVNAELNEEMPNIINITKVMQEILSIVKYHFKIEFSEESLHYYRFVTHLKFFAQRLFNGTHMESQDDFLLETVKESIIARMNARRKSKPTLSGSMSTSSQVTSCCI